MNSQGINIKIYIEGQDGKSDGRYYIQAYDGTAGAKKWPKV